MGTRAGSAPGAKGFVLNHLNPEKLELSSLIPQVQLQFWPPEDGTENRSPGLEPVCGRLSILYCSHWRKSQEAWLDHLSSHGGDRGVTEDMGLGPGEGISSRGLHEDFAEPGTESKAAVAPVQVFRTNLEEVLSGKEIVQSTLWLPRLLCWACSISTFGLYQAVN